MRSLLLALSFTLFFFTACGNDGTISGDASVPGSWKLKRALRNNMETSTLDGLFFEFKENGDLVTNLMGNAKDGSYTVEGTELVTAGVDLPLTYEITELSDSTLNLQSRYQGYQFNFELIRNEE